MPGPFPCRLIIFDLDGTLVDSKADIAQSVNRALERSNLPLLPPDRIAAYVGSGVQILIASTLREAMGREPEEARVRATLEAYLEEYGRHLLDRTKLYDGVAETLKQLTWADMAVVTNKPEGFSRQILTGLGLGKYFRWIMGGDSMPARKPDPGPLREIMRRSGAPPEHTVMVGDSRIDVLAGKAASVLTCGFAGGFRGRRELEEAGCDLIVDRFAEIADLLQPVRA